MASLFSLGRTEEENQQNNNPTTEFWYNTNDDSVVSNSYRGFEIWNQHLHQHQQHLLSLQQPQQQPQDLYSSGVVLGVRPTRVCSSDENRSTVFVGSGDISCQDCGNQAKKDCPHMRCRTCCKSRGFDCQTHVKSTWVPAARRRERQQQLSAPKSSQQQHGERDLNNNNSSLACTRLPTNPSLTLPSAGLLEEMNFPAVVNSPAEFRCVRVSSVDENEEEYAYSTAVNIGGHVFRGILYDYGPDHGNNSYNMATGNASNSSGTLLEGVAQPLNLISSVPDATAVWEIVDPSSLYPAPLNTFMPSSGN